MYIIYCISAKASVAISERQGAVRLYKTPNVLANVKKYDCHKIKNIYTRVSHLSLNGKKKITPVSEMGSEDLKIHV